MQILNQVSFFLISRILGYFSNVSVIVERECAFFMANNYNNQVFLSLRQLFWKEVIKNCACFFIIRNMFFCFIKDNLFTSWRLIFEKRNNSFPEDSIIRNFFGIKAFKVRFQSKKRTCVLAQNLTVGQFCFCLCKSTTWSLCKRNIDSKWVIPNN